MEAQLSSVFSQKTGKGPLGPDAHDAKHTRAADRHRSQEISKEDRAAAKKRNHLAGGKDRSQKKGAGRAVQHQMQRGLALTSGDRGETEERYRLPGVLHFDMNPFSQDPTAARTLAYTYRQAGEHPELRYITVGSSLVGLAVTIPAYHKNGDKLLALASHWSGGPVLLSPGSLWGGEHFAMGLIFFPRSFIFDGKPWPYESLGRPHELSYFRGVVKSMAGALRGEQVMVGAIPPDISRVYDEQEGATLAAKALQASFALHGAAKLIKDPPHYGITKYFAVDATVRDGVLYKGKFGSILRAVATSRGGALTKDDGAIGDDFERCRRMRKDHRRREGLYLAVEVNPNVEVGAETVVHVDPMSLRIQVVALGERTVYHSLQHVVPVPLGRAHCWAKLPAFDPTEGKAMPHQNLDPFMMALHCLGVAVRPVGTYIPDMTVPPKEGLRPAEDLPVRFERLAMTWPCGVSDELTEIAAQIAHVPPVIEDRRFYPTRMALRAGEYFFSAIQHDPPTAIWFAKLVGAHYKPPAWFHQ